MYKNTNVHVPNFKDSLIIEKKNFKKILKNGHPSLAGSKSLNAFRT